MAFSFLAKPCASEEMQQGFPNRQKKPTNSIAIFLKFIFLHYKQEVNYSCGNGAAKILFFFDRETLIVHAEIVDFCEARCGIFSHAEYAESYEAYWTIMMRRFASLTSSKCFAFDVINLRFARRHDEAIQTTGFFLDCFVPRNYDTRDSSHYFIWNLTPR